MTTYTITAGSDKRMFGKRTGAYVAKLMASDSYAPKHSALGTDSASAKQTLLAELARLADAQFSRRYLHCADGTMLVVYLTTNGAAYDITGPTREHTSGVMLTVTTLAEAVRLASAHAEQSYGGVVRQN